MQQTAKVSTDQKDPGSRSRLAVLPAADGDDSTQQSETLWDDPRLENDKYIFRGVLMCRDPLVRCDC